MKKKLKNIANHLLDLGKRNRLLNYKDTGLKSLNILNKNIEELFLDIIDGKVYSIFMLDSVLMKYHKDLIEDPEKDDILSYSDLKVYDIAAKLLKKNQLLCYKRGYPLEKVLYSLLKDYKFTIQEKGINTLYLSFGFIDYTEGKEVYTAPLLLVPVEIKVEKGIYKIVLYEEEVILNPTLKYYFKTEKNVNLIDYENQDLMSYFEETSKLLAKNMVLCPTCSLGIYSFLKINMYDDITSNLDLVVQNKNIRALLGDSTAQIENLIENPVYPVVNCDSSQLEAIGFAANGKSFVLQGPPGSGKSQTITNIISTLIANDKHVLFVSEKLAALKVVYENLRRAGLDDFAIELHSNKANKKEFIENLFKTAILPKYDIDTSAEHVSSKYEALKQNIKEYQKELHQKITMFNCSLYELIAMYYEIEIPSILYKVSNIEHLTLSDLEKICSLFEEYIHYSFSIGYDYKNTPFYGLNDISKEYLRYDIERDFSLAIPYLAKLIEIKDKLNTNIKLNIISITDVYNSLELLEHLVHLKTYHPSYLIQNTRNQLITNIKQYLDIQPILKTNILKKYRESILKEDLEDLYIQYKANCQSFFKFLNKTYRTLNAKILAYRNEQAKSNVLLKELEELIEYKKNLMIAENCLKEIKNHLGNIELSNLNLILADLESLLGYKDIQLDEKDYTALKPYFTDILISFQALSEGNAVLSRISTKFDSSVFNLFTCSVTEALDKLKGIYLKRDKVSDYLLLMKAVQGIEEYQQLNYLQDYLKNGLDIENLSIQYRKEFLRAVIYSILDKSPILNSFTSYQEDKMVEDFQDLDEQILHINRDYIISKLSNLRPNDVLLEGSKFKILVSEYNKLKRQKPIRVLLEEIFELAIQIKPVFLMSPLSVSTYLANQVDMFDCVIFDEASQIFAWDALGAIYRAKQCIIIGDNKQMPPSNFFGVSVDTEEEDNLELDSILDTASLCMLTSRLKWHYRSRSEELIMFSNQAFYDNGLITIPQAKTHERGFGIDFYYLSDGKYDLKTRTNLIEAQKVCDMVFEHYKSSKQSLGVVAFSDVQAKLIESLIEDRLCQYPNMKKYFDDLVDEPFFVKNLESVQGDERDRIIFSICYGYNEDNKFFQRFGPLNNLGGERRLNVAITRAKYNVSVVSSIRYTDIRLNNTDSLGVKMLRDYLEFIENIEHKKEYGDSLDGIVNSVKKYIEDLGYTCYSNYGNSSFKIDLAVMKNDNFVLAIMLDHPYKYKSNTTDKYRLEKMLLERLGWKYYKLYSVAWFNHPEIEQEKLKNVLMNQEVLEEDNIVEDSSYLKQVEDSSLEEQFSEYEELSIAKGKQYLQQYNLSYLLREIIRIEQPIHEEYLYKKVAMILDTNRITNVLKNMVHQALGSDIIKNGKYYSLEYRNSISLRIHSSRTIDQICMEELKHGILTIVHLNNGITIHGCYKALVQLLGYNRVTETTKKILDDAIIYLKLDGSITQRGECLFI